MSTIIDKCRAIARAAIPPEKERHVNALLDAALGHLGLRPASAPAPATQRAAGAEKWSKTYDVDCPHFGDFVQAGGCSCGMGNVHICHNGGDHEVKRGDCQRCYLNRAPEYGRLFLAHGCPECAQVKNLLLESNGAAAVKKLLLNRQDNLRCVTLLEDEGAVKPRMDENHLYHVHDVPGYLADSRLPEGTTCPVLLWRGELFAEPGAIAEKVRELMLADEQRRG